MGGEKRGPSYVSHLPSMLFSHAFHGNSHDTTQLANISPPPRPEAIQSGAWGQRGVSFPKGENHSYTITRDGAQRCQFIWELMQKYIEAANARNTVTSKRPHLKFLLYSTWCSSQTSKILPAYSPTRPYLST